MNPIIQARSLVKRYGAFTAVAGVDFDVAPGECFGLLIVVRINTLPGIISDLIVS